MTIYVYKCDNCGSTQEISHSIHSNKRYRCKQCKHYMKKVLFPPRIMSGPTTIGGLADRNARVLRKSGNSDIIHQKDDGRTTKFRTKSYSEINKMTPERQKKYILTGK